ncbi:MAG TPA: amidohydrolase [Thermotogaceae bacterium]|nr:amidohydrolase [Thermotogaceae bacterium]
MTQMILIKNSKIFDFNESGFVKKDLLIENGKIREISSNLKIQDVKKIDLDGCYLLPGLIDSHMHLINYGRQLSSIDLSAFSNLIEMLEFLKENTNSQVLVARGWNDDLLDRKPDRNSLDIYFADKPVILIRKCGHLAVVNTALIKMFNLSKLRLPKIDLEKGMIAEKALNKIVTLIETNENMGIYIQKAKENLLSLGITAVYSNDIILDKAEELTKVMSKIDDLRVFNEITVESSSDVDSIYLKKLIRKYTDFFDVSSIKIFADGSFGARTAALREPYKDDPKNTGILLRTDQELSEIFSRCKEFKINISIHAIGDRAIEQIIRVLQNTKLDGQNIRIIHFQIADENLIKKVKESEIRVTIQPIFKLSDRILIEKIFNVERKKQVYPFTQLKAHNILLSSSSDAPVESPNPYIGMKILIDEGFSKIDALKTYTLNPAKILNVNNVLGSIEKGKYADFCVFEKDPFKGLKEDPEKLTPDLVFLNGKIVFGKRINYGH